MENNQFHIPVMLNEVIEHIAPKDGAIYIDCTFGAGGYSKRILSSCNCKLLAIDQDPSVNIFVEQIKQQYPAENFIFVNDNFSNIASITSDNNIANVDAIVFDLGVSSMQLDQAERGFSFQKDAKLDMRMGRGDLTAWEVVNKFKEEDLADIIYYYGEETFARSIARRIVRSRKESPINTTLELAKIVRSAVKKHSKIDSATKTFQAIRIYVNDELTILKHALVDAYNLLKINGKIIIVSFQGLEDKIIKDFLNKIPLTATCKAIKPSLEEIKQNPRSRSAKLRALIKNSPDLIAKEQVSRRVA